MVCLGTGTPRVYSTGSAEVVQIVTSPKGLICAVLTVAELQLWGAGTARVRLAVEKLNPRRDGAPLGLVWRADGLSLCVWSTKGVLLSFELALSAREWVPSSGAGSALTLNIHSHISYPSSGGVDVPDATDMFVDVASTKIVGKSVTRVGRYGRFTSVVADDDSLFAATDSGELLAFVWKFVGPASLLSAGGGPQPPPASASPHAPASHHPLRYVSDPAPLHLISVTKVTALLAQLAPPPPSLTPPTPSLMAAFSSSAAASAAASEFAPLPPANGAGGDEAAAAGAGAAPSGTPLAADSMASPAAVAATPPPNVLHIVSLDMPRRSHFVATVSNGSLTQFQLTYFSYGLPSAAVGDADTDAGPAPPSPSSSGGGRAASDSSSDSFTARTTRECAQQLQARAPAALSSPAGGGGGELAGCEHCSALVKGSFTHSLSAAGSAAEMKVRVNKKRGLLALTHGCKVVLRDINDPVHKVATLGMEGWGWRHADLGPVRDLVWSTDGAVLAVIYAKRGVAVFHWSGACLLTSLQRNGPGGDGSDLAGSGRTPPPTPLNRLSSCSALTSVAFDPLAYSLMLSYGDGGKFLQLALARSLTSVNPTANSGPHVVMCTATSVLLFSHPDLGHLKDNWDALSPPSCYTAAYAPLKYTAFSGDGNHCVVAGLKGCALYNTKLKRWRLWAAPEQEAEIELVCPPTWVSNVAVCLPVKRQPRASRRAAAAAAAAALASPAPSSPVVYSLEPQSHLVHHHHNLVTLDCKTCPLLREQVHDLNAENARLVDEMNRLRTDHVNAQADMILRSARPQPPPPAPAPEPQAPPAAEPAGPCEACARHAASEAEWAAEKARLQARVAALEKEAAAAVPSPPSPVPTVPEVDLSRYVSSGEHERVLRECERLREEVKRSLASASALKVAEDNAAGLESVIEALRRSLAIAEEGRAKACEEQAVLRSKHEATLEQLRAAFAEERSMLQARMLQLRAGSDDDVAERSRLESEVSRLTLEGAGLAEDAARAQARHEKLKELLEGERDLHAERSRELSQLRRAAQEAKEALDEARDEARAAAQRAEAAAEKAAADARRERERALSERARQLESQA
eukprot:Rhum_TRINITY_DN18862_c0_g1::Rhum_TRINITY_DN18862_c0_g1_i1::g.168636::m.168636